VSAKIPSAPTQDLAVVLEINRWLEARTAQERIAWALQALPGSCALSTSFGAQAALMLHMVTQQCPHVPVIFIDTGYLFSETYRFADELADRLQLNLKVYRSQVSPAWQEARHGRLWEQGTAGLERYNRMNKVEPMRQALAELGTSTWFAGLRRLQSASRNNVPILEWRETRWKFCPVADWDDRQVWRYLKAHGLPYHPLWDQGYVSIGDAHSTRPLETGMSGEDTRFFGLKRECGLHLEI
jgi:phosphoadenosine phosphosulfate reductase